MVKHRLEADVIIAELIKVLADALLDHTDLQVLLLKGLRQLHLARHFIVVHQFAHSRYMLVKLVLRNLPVFLLACRHMCHDLGELHLALLV